MNNVSNEEGTAEGFAAVTVLKPRWGWIMLSGFLTVLFGILAFWMPLGAVYTMTLLFGAYAMADGALSVISAVRNKENFWPLMLRGVLGLFAGFIVLVMPGISALSLVAFTWGMLSIWSIATGLMELIAAVRLRKEIEGEWLLGLSGLVSMVFGIAIPVLLWSNPAAGIVSMGYMIGFYAILHGALEIGLSMALRKFQSQA